MDKNYVSSNCSDTEKNTIYFRCNDYGHISSKCTKKLDYRQCNIVGATVEQKLLMNVQVRG